MNRRSTNIKDVYGREIFEGDVVENEAIRDRVVYRGGNWTTELNVDDQPLTSLMPIEVVEFSESPSMKLLKFPASLPPTPQVPHTPDHRT